MNDKYYDIDNSLFQRILKDSEPSEQLKRSDNESMKIYNVSNLYPTVMEEQKPENESEYGCTVCKYNEKCEPTPFGICSKYERKQEQ